MIPVMMVPTNFYATHMAQQAMIPSTGANMDVAAEKVNRELFVGNTPKGTSEELLIHFLNGAMKRTGLCLAGCKPIIACRVSEKFAFVECVTVEDANLLLNLNGIPFMGINLRISRPSKYNGPYTTSKTWKELTNHKPPNNCNSSLVVPADDRVNRELFVGNTTPEMTENGLMSFLGEAMEKVKLTTAAGNPLTACQISGKFAFIELRSAEETINALNLNNIPYKGTHLNISRPSKYAGPQYPSKTWQELTGEPMLTDQNAMAAGAAKFNRELFVGNITSDMNEESLISFLGNAMRQVRLASEKDGNPIIGCRLCGKFAFLELRSVDETTSGLHLNNIPFRGIRLKVRRPSKYIGPETPIGDWDTVLTAFLMGTSHLGVSNPECPGISKGILTNTGTNYKSVVPTRIVELKNMITAEDLECDSEYDDIAVDTREECAKFGTLKNAIIPRSGMHATKIFLEYETVQDAISATRHLAQRTFDGQTVKATYCKEFVLEQLLKK